MKLYSFILGVVWAVTCPDQTARLDAPEAVWGTFCKAYTQFLGLAEREGLKRPYAPRLDYNCGIISPSPWKDTP